MIQSKPKFTPARGLTTVLTAAAVFVAAPLFAQSGAAGTDATGKPMATDVTRGDPTVREGGASATGAAVGIAPHGPGRTGAAVTGAGADTTGTAGAAGAAGTADTTRKPMATDVTRGDPTVRGGGASATGQAVGSAPHGPGRTGATVTGAGADTTRMTGGTAPAMGTGGATGAAANLDSSTVRELQQALRDRGQDVQIDGIWGPATASALRQFQQQQGMQATGQPDRQTLSALGVQARAGGTMGAGGTTRDTRPPTGPTGAVGGSTAAPAAGGGTGASGAATSGGTGAATGSGPAGTAR